MSDLEVSDQLINLSDDYSNNRVSFSEYRLQRQVILRNLDEEYNQVYFESEPDAIPEDSNIAAEVVDDDDVIDEAALAQELEQ